MIIYNVTINIDESVHDEWLQWMQTKHIKDVLNTGCFTSARLVKVLVAKKLWQITKKTTHLYCEMKAWNALPIKC